MAVKPKYQNTTAKWSKKLQEIVHPGIYPNTHQLSIVRLDLFESYGQLVLGLLDRLFLL